MSSEKIQGDLVGDGMEVQGIGSYDGGAWDGTDKGRGHCICNEGRNL